jgi:hypothetical protein
MLETWLETWLDIFIYAMNINTEIVSNFAASIVLTMSQILWMFFFS